MISINQKKSYRKYYDLFFIIMLFGFSIWLQKNILLNWDVSWHLLGAKRMLSGAGYLTGVFDDNPPMVFWIEMPVVLLAHYFSISIITVHLIFVECLILCTFVLCHTFLKSFYNQPVWQFHCIRYAILFSLLFFQSHAFGQREMLLTIFCLPYITLMGARIKNVGQFNTLLLSFTGLWLGLGVALNPFYGFIVVALEVQRAVIRKRIFPYRPEIVAFVIVSVTYLLFIYFWYPSYYTDIIPAVLTFSPGFNATWHDIFLNYPAVLFFAVTLTFMVTDFTRESKHWATTLWIAAAVSFIMYVINKKIWYYHTFPFLVLTFLLSIILFTQITDVARQKKIFLALCYVISYFFSLSFTVFFCFMIVKTSIDSAINKGTLNHHFFRFVHFFKQKSVEHHTLYTLVTSFYPTFPMIDYTTMRYLPGRPDCWTIPIIVKNLSHQTVTGWRLKLIQKYQQQFLNETTSDFQTLKPEYVIVDNSIDKPYLHGITFNYIHFLNQNPTFRKIWKQYVLVKTIDNQNIYARTHVAFNVHHKHAE